MTEEEWLNCADAALLLRSPALVEPTERRLVLFLLAAGLIDSVELATRLNSFVEGKISRNDLNSFFRFLVPHRRPFRFTSNTVSALVGLNPSAQNQTAHILRDIFGNPFRPVAADPTWLTPTVHSLAAAIYEERAFDRLPILADALEDAGCTNADVLLHCRQPGEHVRGCWVVDLALGKA